MQFRFVNNMKKAIVSENQNTIFEYSQKYNSPILFAYVSWVLSNALKKGINRLYFLARDGYLMWWTAKLIVARKRMKIDCRYLCCSRIALRTASYHIIGDEALKLICTPSMHITPRVIFARARIPEEKIKLILNDICLDWEVDKTLNEMERCLLQKRLDKSVLFHKVVKEISQNAYKAAKGYFAQEGLTDSKNIAIVENGWAGTIQRSLRQILEFMTGKKILIIGYYFGLYNTSHDEADGAYHAWYFSPDRSNRRKVFFNDHLWECMITAPHGMTLGYKKKKDRFLPVFEKYELNTDMRMQVKGTMVGIRNILNSENADTIDHQNLEWVESLLWELMVCPSRHLAETYGKLPFCDDSSNLEFSCLATEDQCKYIKDYAISRRIWNKITCGVGLPGQRLYWPLGVVSLMHSSRERLWYRCNIILREVLRIYLQGVK